MQNRRRPPLDYFPEDTILRELIVPLEISCEENTALTVNYFHDTSIGNMPSTTWARNLIHHLAGEDAEPTMFYERVGFEILINMPSTVLRISRQLLQIPAGATLYRERMIASNENRRRYPNPSDAEVWLRRSNTTERPHVVVKRAMDLPSNFQPQDSDVDGVLFQFVFKVSEDSFKWETKVARAQVAGEAHPEETLSWAIEEAKERGTGFFKWEKVKVQVVHREGVLRVTKGEAGYKEVLRQIKMVEEVKKENVEEAPSDKTPAVQRNADPQITLFVSNDPNEPVARKSADFVSSQQREEL